VRVLFASTRGTGHFNPLVPFIEASLRGGHEVMVAGPPPLAEQVARAGYRFWEGAVPPEDELGAAWGRVPTVSPDEANAIVIGEIFAGLNVRAMLPSLLAACEEWRPDVVIREQAEFASAIAAERHGLRHARLSVSLAPLDQMGLELAGAHLDEQQPGIADRIWSSPYLTYLPAALEDPAVPRPPAIHRFRDPAATAPGEPLPDWWHGDSRTLVYVSFGSVTGTMPHAEALYAAVFEAAAEIPARVLLTVGSRDVDIDALGPAPANLHVEPWVTPADVLPQAAAVVSHGGFGTTLGAVAAGLPLVVVPLFGDQPHNARRVEEVGAGISLWPDPSAPPEAVRSGIDPAGLRDAITTVLEDPSYGRTASAFAGEMAALPPTDAAMDAIAVTDAR
jgi:UDP:flavonoid glycosyltransferase YjiC (YdhE family)